MPRMDNLFLWCMSTEILFDVIKNVAFLSCQRDDVLIREGDQGDWYVVSTTDIATHLPPSPLRSFIYHPSGFLIQTKSLASSPIHPVPSLQIFLISD